MCGVAGVYNLKESRKPDSNMLQRMISTLGHRGPDSTGFYIDEHVGLAHARLSIIDLESGEQPIHNMDKSVWVIFNGEIYNYVEIKLDLEKKGYRFYTHSDTEVIVHLYDEYGENFVDHLNGQFAIVLWDNKSRKLVLTRDRVGIAPLFYSVFNNKLYFGSEIKAILAAMPEKPQLNLQALDQLLTFWSPVTPNTIFDNIYEVSPGQILTVNNGNIYKRIYWDWNYPIYNDFRSDKFEDIVEEVKSLLIDATRIRLRADVPVGAYLSGGLDSSVLVSIIKNYTDTDLKTFSIEFDEGSLDESSYQQELINHLDTQHRKIRCSDGDIVDNFRQAIWHTELPILRSAPIPMSLLSSLVHESDYKVVLTGEGSDEVFGGYDIFKESKIRQFWAANPHSSCRPILLKKLYPYLDVSPGKAQRYLENFFGQGLDTPELNYFSHIPRWETTSKIKQFFSADVKASLLNDAVTGYNAMLPEDFDKLHPFTKGQYIESKTLMSGYLLCSQGDRMLMMNSVEGRFPFLDHRVIEFANTLHPKYKMKGLNEKYILKKAMGDQIPQSIVERHKQPYRAPDISSFTGNNIRQYVEDLLSADRIEEYNYFDKSKTSLLMKKINAGKAIGYKDNMAFMAILSTQCLHEQFIKNFEIK